MLDTLSDDEIRSLHDGYKAALLARKEIIEVSAGDTSVTKQLTFTVREHGALIAREFRRRFPAECRPRHTRTVVAFS